MSRLNLDYLSAAFSFEPTTTSTAPTDTGQDADTFDNLLQRAGNSATSRTESDRADADAAQHSQTNRKAPSGGTSGDRQRPSPDDDTSTSANRTDEKSPPTATASESGDAEERAVAESDDPDTGDTNREHHGPDDAERVVAVVIAAQVTPEPIAGPAGELILSDAAPTVASDGGATGDVEAPSSPITAMRTTETQLTNSLTNPLAGPWMEPQAGAPTEATAEPPSAAGELVVNLPGEAASQAATEVTGNPVGQSVESMATAEETESAAAALEPNVSSDEQLAATAEADDVPQANAGAASSATTDDEKPRGKTHRAANSAVDGVQAQGNTEPRVPSPEVDSSSTSLDEAATALTPDPTAQLQDRKTEKAALAVKAVATDATGGDLGPQARDSTVTQSATVSQGSGQTASAGEQMDRVRFVQRVARAFESIGGDGGSIRLRLHPPELGSLRLELTLRNGAMNAHLEADTPAARNLLLDNLPALRERLAQQNIKVEQFDVDLADQGTNGSWQQPSDQAHPETGQPGGGSRQRKPQESTAENTSAARTAPRYGEGSGFDVTI